VWQQQNIGASFVEHVFLIERDSADSLLHTYTKSSLDGIFHWLSFLHPISFKGWLSTYDPAQPIQAERGTNLTLVNHNDRKGA